MNIKQHTINIGGIEVVVLRKRIKNLYLRVLVPNGVVRVSAPLYMKDDTIHTFVISRIDWIKKQQAKFEGQEIERKANKQYVSGEFHYYLGNRYLLEVKNTNNNPKVELANQKKIILTVQPCSNIERRELILNNWYRKELRKIAEPMFEKWQKSIGVNVIFWGIKQMKTKWGSCNIKTKRIWLSQELIKKPESSIEYVVVHELVHLLEKSHNGRFKQLMSHYLPNWSSTKADLNRLILSI